MAEEFDLKESVEKLGKLVPILKDAFGNIIDGFHRYKIDPDWPSITLEHIDDPTKLEKARVAINQCRRVVDAEERAEGYGKLIKMTGWTPKELAENIGIPYRTIMRYLPDEHKEKSWDREPIATVAIGHESVKVDGEVGEELESVTTKAEPREFLAAPLICKTCGISTRLYPENFKMIDGHTYCLKCAKNVKPLSRLKPGVVEPPKVKEPWSERRAHMAPQVSSMEQHIRLALTEKSVSFETDKEFCLQSTTPDLWLPKRNLAVYLDGSEVHMNRRDKDEFLRELLTKRHGVRVLSITFKGTSQTEQDRVLSQILEVAQNG